MNWWGSLRLEAAAYGAAASGRRFGLVVVVVVWLCKRVWSERAVAEVGTVHQMISASCGRLTSLTSLTRCCVTATAWADPIALPGRVGGLFGPARFARQQRRRDQMSDSHLNACALKPNHWASCWTSPHSDCSWLALTHRFAKFKRVSN